uniref:Galactose oxidase-like Early set domain-containing protein n=1 Tax=Araucaria cunninghamii TaxID=56994 RepID=A0A0D6R2K5_ARACU
MVQRLMKFLLVCVLVQFLSENRVRGEEKQVLPGRWELLLQNAGVSAMHMTLMHTNKVLIYDRMDTGPSNITLPDAGCQNVTASDEWQHPECWSHSVEYDIASNNVRPLHLQSNTWCSSGAFLSNGTLVQTGGFDMGENKTRYYTPCYDSTCNWVEAGTTDLVARRWYASNQILPDNRVIVVGGEFSYSYEFVPRAQGEGLFELPFLAQTTNWTYVHEYDNLYPFLHLSSDGNLFVFANRDSILLDYAKNQVVKTFPQIPGGPRNYATSGSSIMFPLDYDDNFQRVEVMICGGAPAGAYGSAENQSGPSFVPALRDCGRMEITSANPQWVMEDIPGPRLMGDMLILPTAEILIINGGRAGSAGYQDAREPVLNPWLYRAQEPLGNRFSVLGATTIPRLYHSTAIVLPDGRVLVAGSNPNKSYNFSSMIYSKTELRMEAYSPYYLDPQYDSARVNISDVPSTQIKYGSNFTIGFSISAGAPGGDVRFHAYAPPFNTHTVSMSQRMLSLAAVTPILMGNDGLYRVSLMAPPTAVAAPPGYYLLSVVNDGIPSRAEWISLGY